MSMTHERAKPSQPLDALMWFTCGALLATAGCTGSILTGPGMSPRTNEPPRDSRPTSDTPPVQSPSVDPPATMDGTDQIRPRVVRLSLDEFQTSVHDLFPNSGCRLRGLHL